MYLVSRIAKTQHYKQMECQSSLYERLGKNDVCIICRGYADWQDERHELRLRHHECEHSYMRYPHDKGIKVDVCTTKHHIKVFLLR